MSNSSAKPLIGITGDIEDRNGRTYFYIDLRYGRMIEEAGGIPLLLHPTDFPKDVLGRVRGLLLSGGEDIHPKYYGEEAVHPMTLSPDLRTDFETALLKEALSMNLPVLGICHGMQLINVAFGGTLYQDIPSQRSDAMNHRLGDKRHRVSVEEGSILFNVVGKTELDVTSTHHQAVKELGTGLRECAKAGDGIVEAFERQEHPFFIGVQWHPEKEPDDASRRLFLRFVESCK